MHILKALLLVHATYATLVTHNATLLLLRLHRPLMPLIMFVFFTQAVLRTKLNLAWLPPSLQRLELKKIEVCYLGIGGAYISDSDIWKLYMLIYRVFK